MGNYTLHILILNDFNNDVSKNFKSINSFLSKDHFSGIEEILIHCGGKYKSFAQVWAGCHAYIDEKEFMNMIKSLSWVGFGYVEITIFAFDGLHFSRWLYFKDSKEWKKLKK